MAALQCRQTPSLRSAELSSTNAVDSQARNDAAALIGHLDIGAHAHPRRRHNGRKAVRELLPVSARRLFAGRSSPPRIEEAMTISDVEAIVGHGRERAPTQRGPYHESYV